jgi:hypothetical protein
MIEEKRNEFRSTSSPNLVVRREEFLRNRRATIRETTSFRGAKGDNEHISTTSKRTSQGRLPLNFPPTFVNSPSLSDGRKGGVVLLGFGGGGPGETGARFGTTLSAHNCTGRKQPCDRISLLIANFYLTTE